MTCGRPEDLDITNQVLRCKIPAVKNGKSWLRHTKGAAIIDEMLLSGSCNAEEIGKKIFKLGFCKKLNGEKGAISRANGHIRHLENHWNVKMAPHGINVTNENGILKIAVPNRVCAEDELYCKSKEDVESFNAELGISGNPEGNKKTQTVSFYERDPKNRAEAIRKHGMTCIVCNFNFEEKYGERGAAYIEVHHKNPLYKSKMSQVIDPEKDLTVLCSNCHRMIHRKKDQILTIEELKRMVRK
jgi:predicted HNH restriction endonuclease